MIDLTWHEQAVCRGEHTATFYRDENEYPELLAKLRQMCDGCPVFEKCRAHAITWEAFGFWAGPTESERHSLRRSMKITRRPIRLSYLGKRPEDP